MNVVRLYSRIHDYYDILLRYYTLTAVVRGAEVWAAPPPPPQGQQHVLNRAFVSDEAQSAGFEPGAGGPLETLQLLQDQISAIGVHKQQRYRVPD